MCASCGCRRPYSDHDNARNITLPTLLDAALAAGIPPEMAIQNMSHSLTAADPVRAFMTEISRPRIVCDIDGTLAERDLAALVAINSKFDTAFRYRDMTATQGDWIEDKDIRKWYAKHHHDPIFLLDLPPYDEAIWALWSLHSGGYHVTIASDREADLLPLSTDWLDEHGVQYDAVRVGDGEKLALAQGASPQEPVVFIDDNPARAEDLPRPGVTVYLLDRPWNQGVRESPGVVRVKEWKDLLAFFPALFTGVQPVAGAPPMWSASTALLSPNGKSKRAKKAKTAEEVHVRVRRWSDGKWHLQHRDTNRRVDRRAFATRADAIGAAHEQGWVARAGTDVIRPG
jgi:uncharacterized HAD superfamily protein